MLRLKSSAGEVSLEKVRIFYYELFMAVNAGQTASFQ